MKQTLLFIFFLNLTFIAFGQINAVTEKGEQVVLYDNGTWKSLETKPAWETRLDTLKFNKSASSSFLVKSDRVKCGVWINPKKWKFRKDENGSAASEFKFTLINEDAYAMLITEKIEIPLNRFKEAALGNAKKAAPDAHLVKEEIRKINGIIICMLQMEATIDGINFVYLGYYYSDADGSTQFLSYTSKNLFEQYKNDLEQFLNGFVKL